MNDRSLILAALQEVTVDALVTNQHAAEMADQLAAILDRWGLTIVAKQPPADLDPDFREAH